jgi:septum formation protein
MHAAPSFFLASQSPRRHELLREAGFCFEPLAVAVAEAWDGVESGQAYLERVVADKLRAALAARADDRPVLVADTEVLLDDRPLGKPADAEDAAATLRALSGRAHWVVSRVMLADGARTAAVQTETEILFDTLSEARIQRYCASGEPMGKAGSYAIQGAAAGFIRQIKGSLSGVIGLPLAETRALLAGFGIHPA